jgi:Lipoprotein LpqB beta-propeller domain/Sporulation and spore germination
MIARPFGLVLATAAAAALTSCVAVPHEGPVVEARPQAEGAPGQQPYSNPPPPAPGASPDDIVSGFLEAMTATPLRTGPARAYLTQAGVARWRPRQVLIFGGHSPPRGKRHVVLDLRGADRIGAGGQFQGRVSAADRRVTFPMALENGEWRIAQAPNALILQRSFYAQNYTSQDTSQNTNLYYFDPTGHILVPEPVHVPQGSQLATSLVKALLRGPRDSLGRVERSYIPRGLSVLPIVVDRDLAEVSLTGPDPGPLSSTTTQMMLAQFAWTLRQDPSIRSFTLSVVDRTVTDSTGVSRFPVTATEFDRYDPADNKASSQTYGLRKGRLVSGPVDQLTKVNGPFGSQDQGISSFAVSVDGTTGVAAVRSDTLLVGSVLGEEQPVPMLFAPGLLRPAWDSAKRLWDVENRPDGAVVVYVANQRPHEVTVPGITGENVHRFLISRDGSRLIAVLRGPTTDRIVASRLRYNADGRVIDASRVRPIRWVSSASSRIRDIGWTSPTTIAVLNQVSPVQAEVRILNVDGSTRPHQVSPIAITGAVLGLVTSPSNQTPYAFQPSGLVDISPAETSRPPATNGLRRLTYSG